MQADSPLSWVIIVGLLAVLFKDIFVPMFGFVFKRQSANNEDIAQLKADVATLLREQASIAQKQEAHDSLRDAVTEMKVEIRNLRDSLKTQPQMIGQVVAMTIKETFAILGVRRMAA